MSLRSGLSKREALLLRELALTPGRAVSMDILIDALDLAGNGTYRQQRKAVSAYVHFIRWKFGDDVIQTVLDTHGMASYSLAPGALR